MIDNSSIMYSDLSCDYINPIDMCNKLNPYILPEIGVHAVTTLLLLVSGNWVSLLINIPLIAWNVKKVMDKDTSLDATEIFRTINRHQTESFAKLGMYLVLFFWYLFQMISTLIADE